MTKKHFITLSNAVSELKDYEERRKIAVVVSEVCKAHNSRFDQEKFNLACGLGKGQIK